MTIGTKIRNLRDEKGWSQSDLAFKIGIGQTTLGSIESGETKKIDFLLMGKICKEFNVDSDYFKETTKLRQVNHDHSIGYIENQIINNLSEKLIEQFENQIKDLRDQNNNLENRNIDLEEQIKILKLEIVRKNKD